MSKNKNYYSIHKNKKPKRLIKKKPNLLVLKQTIISMQAFSQHAIIVAQSFKSVAEKSFAVAENVKKHAEALSNVYKEERKYKYLKKATN